MLVLLAGTAVDDGAAIGPGAEWGIAVGVGQGVVRRGQTELTVFGETAVDEDVLILNFADAGGLEEAETARLVATRDHVFHNLGARFHGGHCLRVELGSIATLKAPITVDTSVIIDKHGRVELKHADHLVRVISIPVAHLERTIGPVALCYQSVA